MASWPTANGITAATRLPKATSKSARVAGITRLSPRSHVVGAGFANVEIQRNLARQFELHGGITAPQLIFKRVCPLVKLGNERLHWAFGRRRGPREQTFHRPCPGRSDRATRDGKRLRTRRVRLSVPPQWWLTLARLPPNPRVEVPESPGPRGQRMANENEWSSSCADNFRFAAFDAGCRLQMALGVKGEWKKRNDGGKDYPGHPETAHMHETHDVIQNRRQLSDMPFVVGIKTLRS